MNLHVRIRRLARFEFARFIVVGIVNTLACYVVYAVFLLLSANFKLASLMALVFGTAMSFLMQGKYVFYNRSRALIFRFLAVAALNYVVNILLIGSLKNLGVNPFLGGFVALPLGSVFSYLGSRYFVFRPQRFSDRRIQVR